MKLALPVYIGFSFIFLFLTRTQPVFAQVKINEFSPNSESGSDWVELYNNSDQKIDLTTYTLVDGSTSGNPKNFSCSLEPKGFWAVDWSSNLNNGGDIIKLKNGDQVVDCVTYGNWTTSFCEGQTQVTLPEIKENEFGARNEDGVESWRVVSLNTKDYPNNGAAKNPTATCLTPSPSPSPSPSPGASPSPSPTASTSSSQTAASPSPSPTPTPSPSPHPSPVIRITDIVLLDRKTPEPVLGTHSSQPANPIDWQLALMLITAGTGLLLVTAIIIVRLWRKN